MKYKITENQNALIGKLNERKLVREQPFIAQSAMQPVSEAGGLSALDDSNFYTVNVTIELGKVDGVDDKQLAAMPDKQYFTMVEDDVKNKILEAFKTHEFTIHTIANKKRGEINPLYLER